MTGVQYNSQEGSATEHTRNLMTKLSTYVCTMQAGVVLQYFDSAAPIDHNLGAWVVDTSRLLTSREAAKQQLFL